MRRQPLYYTFGNHMHWVDMQWLWGYSVLPGSTDDMLALCAATGVRGNVNFDAVGYERMAAECPDALRRLRAAVAAGTIEPVGCSYGQPYALFQGGESNVRQFVHGVAATCRALGVRPRTFWEEEFYFYPQLVQVLRSCGYEGACLFFQWTWHTPELPREEASIVQWEGIDGSGLPALPRHALNVHQWPEDFDGLLERAIEHRCGPAAVVQWLELMPSRDWMCRSEVLRPRLEELLRDSRFDVRPRTAGGLIRDLLTASRSAPPVRRYRSDDVWHGMTLGKNADAHPRASRRAESAILTAESLSTVASLLGRPYASWDLYPTWELDEAWRETLVAQHHDNHECEGLCGFIGHASFERACRLAGEVSGRSLALLAGRSGAGSIEGLRWNRHGWARRFSVVGPGRRRRDVVVPPFGYTRTPAAGVARESGKVLARKDRAGIRLSRGGFAVSIDGRGGQIVGIDVDGRRLLGPSARIGGLRMRRGDRAVRFSRPTIEIEREPCGPVVVVKHTIGRSGRIEVRIALADDLDAIDCAIRILDSAAPDGPGPRPDPGLASSLQWECDPDIPDLRVHADAPYSLEEVRGSGRCRRKYPRGDWMTSPQWFEEVHDPFTASTLVDLVGPTGAGLLVAHDGSQQWFRDGAGVRAVLTAYDPWDESRYSASGRAQLRLRLLPHSHGLRNAERVQASATIPEPIDIDTYAAPVGGGADGAGPGTAIPKAFGVLEVSGAPNVLAHAAYRDGPRSGEHLPRWAGHELARRSDGACSHPVVIRLVEWDGEPADVVLKLPGPVALAAKTTLLGEVGTPDEPIADTMWLETRPSAVPAWARGTTLAGRSIPWTEVRFSMRPREIATVMVDLVLGRKAWRDLDAKRQVWATAHKNPARGAGKT